MPQVPLPEDLQPLSFYLNQAPERLSKFAQTLLNKPQAFEFRPVQLPVYLDPTPRAATKSVWFRPSGVVPVDNETLHYCLLAYVSDYNLIDTALLPHGQSPMVIKMASLDHALWFHRPFCMDDWLLYSTDSPTASGGRALARGHIYSRDGVLVASTVQEGLIRPKPAP